MIIKKETKLKISDNRKGVYYAIANNDFDTEDEWYDVRLDQDYLDGMSITWYRGDKIPARKGIVYNVEIIDADKSLDGNNAVDDEGNLDDLVEQLKIATKNLKKAIRDKEEYHSNCTGGHAFPEVDGNTYCTECPYFTHVTYDGEQWFGANCKKDGHSTMPSMFAIKSLHDDCPLVTKIDPKERNDK